MNEFELFTMIYFALDAFYGTKIEDVFICTVISDMNPFIWSDIGSADPAMYSDYIRFLNGRTITIDNSLDIAKEYLETIDYADVTDALKDMTTEEWASYCRKYLAEPHKGGRSKRRIDHKLWKYYELSRYACYLIVQNGDPRKEVMALGKRREIKKHIDSHIMSGIIVVVSSRKISMEE